MHPSFDGLNLCNKADVYEALNRTNGDEIALVDVLMALFALGGMPSEHAQDAFDGICYFYTDSTCAVLAKLSLDAVDRLCKTAPEFTTAITG